MTHSLSSTVADRPPAMYRSATTVMVVSSTSMKVGTTTIAATTQGFVSAWDLAGESASSVICRARQACGRSASRRSLLDVLKEGPGIGSAQRLVEIDVWDNRSAYEQRFLVRIVGLKLNPDRQPL